MHLNPIEGLARVQFKTWMAEHGKAYATPVEEAHRFNIFRQNMEFIRTFRGGFEVGVNEFADMNGAEFAMYMKGYIYNASHDRDDANFPPTLGANPTAVDWRTKNAVTGVKNQGQCGSCWSFSTTGSVEGAHAIKTGSLVSLSEQNLMDCSWSYGNFGCNGGEMVNAFKYIIANKGIDTEASYPYTEKDGSCHYKAANSGATISSYKTVTTGSESALETATATVGPVSVAIDASHPSFQFYKSGIYYEPACSSTKLDHGVLVVGYGTQGGTNGNYWIVKNSWGVTWGQQGYIWMAKNRNNNCGIATDASYPTV